MCSSWLPRERLFALEQWVSTASYLESFSPGIASGDGFLCVLENGKSLLLGRYPDFVTRIPWFQAPSLLLVHAVFSPSEDFILCLSKNASIHIISLEGTPLSSAHNGKHELHRKAWRPREGRRLFSPPIQWTGEAAGAPREALCVLWWNYGDLVSAALLGTREGVLIVVDLVTAVEMGRVFISKYGVATLEMVWDNAMDCYYVIVTDGAQKQWRLLLEQRSSGYCWPRAEEGGKALTPPPTPERPPQALTLKTSNSIDDLSTPPRSRIAAGIKNMSVASLASLRQKISEGKRILDRMGGSAYGHEPSSTRPTCRPESISAKMGDTHISVQGTERPDISILVGVHSSSAVLTVHNYDLEAIPGKAYKLPKNAKKVLLMSRVILASGSASNAPSYSLEEEEEEDDDEEDEEAFFPEEDSTTESNGGDVLYIVSSAQAEFSTGPSKSSRGHPLVQSFRLSPNEKVLGFHVIKRDKDWLKESSMDSESPSHFENFDSEVSHRLKSFTQKDNIRRHFQDVLIFTSKGIHILVLRRDPISSFLELSMRGEMALADRVASAFVMDSKSLLELAGDIRLRDNDYTGAVNLYRSAGMKHLKIVLKLSYSGHIPELLHYLSSLFKTPNVDVTPNERSHLSNLALMAYFQQVLTKITPSTRFDFRNEIKGFMSSNRHFDEALAIRLAADTKEWDLLSYFSRSRGLRHEAVGSIIQVIQSLIGEDEADEIGKDSLKLISVCLQEMPSVERNSLLSCLLDPLNLECCASTVIGMNLIKILSGSLPLLEEEGLQAVACMSVPENPAFRPYFRKEESLFFASSFLNLFITSLLLLIKKRNVEATFNPRLTEISGALQDQQWPRKEVHHVRVNILAAGGNHVLLLRQSAGGSRLFTWGSTSRGALGRGSRSSNYEALSEVPYFSENGIRVISVAAGAYHSLALTDFGVYSWGISKYGQLGHGNTLDQKRPTLIKALSHLTVIDICAGRYHSLALDSNGGVWSWGLGVHGQLGLDDIEDVHTPTQVISLRRVKVSQIAAGYTHSVCLSSKGRIYSFGNNLFGQLGNGLTEKSNVPTKTDISVCRVGERIVRMKAGFFHTLALTNHGRLLTWGSNPQIIRLETQSKKRLFLQNLRNSRISVSSKEGNNAISQSFHCNDEKGSNPVNSNPPAVKKTETQATPPSPELPHLRASALDLSEVEGRVIAFSGGNQHSMILTDLGLLYGLGLNSQGQLGNQSRSDSKALLQVPGLSDNRLIGVVCGMDFTLAMSDNGTLFGWGNNSCGTLGKAPIIENGDRSYKEKILLMPSRRIKLNHPPPNSWDVPKPVPGTMPTSSYESLNYFPSFNQSVSVEFEVSLSSNTHYDIRSSSQVPHYLHSTLEGFHSFLDTKTLIKKCLISENPQAASKISLLEGNMLQAFEFTLQSIIKSHHSGHHSSSEAVFGAFKYYLTMSASRSFGERDEEEDEEDRSKSERRNLFERLVACWQDQKWSFVHLENLITENAGPVMLQVLVITLFCPSNERRTDKGPVINQDSGPKLVDLFTPEFCLKIGDTFVNGLKEQDDYWQNERAIRKWLMTQKSSKSSDLLGNSRKT